MTNHGLFQRMSIWRVAILFAFTLFVVLTSASAPGGRPLATVQAATTPDVSAVTSTVSATSDEVSTAATDSHGCPFHDFCLWTGKSFTGTKFEVSRCGVEFHASNFGDGSWDNNQTAGTRVKFIKKNGFNILTSAGAHDVLAAYDFSDLGTPFFIIC